MREVLEMQFPEEITITKSGGSMSNPDTLTVNEWVDENTVRVEGRTGFRGLITISEDSNQPPDPDEEDDDSLDWRDDYQDARAKIRDMDLAEDIDLTSSHDALVDFIEAHQ